MTQSLAEYLNTCCTCQTLDEQALAGQLTAAAGGVSADNLTETHPNLFAHERVFVSAQDFSVMRQTVELVDRLGRSAAYRQQVIAGRHSVEMRDPGTLGVFNSFDFHLTPAGPALIEINTNAGGAFLTAMASGAHGVCCEGAGGGNSLGDGFEQRVIEMFETEWRLGGNSRALRTIAIVDDGPCEQFLYPDFLLAKSVLERAGYEVVIADAGDLNFDGERLSIDGVPIDLVYNRLTDFRLQEARHRALRLAADTDAAVVTPHPFHHATMADKHNLVWLSDRENWSALGLNASEERVLAQIPHAEIVSEINAERLWRDKKSQFFKPFDGFGSKGVYRGDKLTKSSWANILKGGYLAQARVRPAERLVRVDGVDRPLKFDIRVFAYGPEIVLLGARLYQGQVTNMRTVSGGLAPVSVG